MAAFADGGGRPAEVSVSLAKKSRDEKALGPVRVTETDERVSVTVLPHLWVDPETDPRLQASLNTKVRESVGAAVAQLERLNVTRAEFRLDLPAEQLSAALTGLEIALYRFKRVLADDPPKLALSLNNKGRRLSAAQVRDAASLGQAVNLARHLVNLPPNWLNPPSYADFITTLFAGMKGVKVGVWDENRLRQERMNLHLAVGQGSATPPRLVHVRYRPAGALRREAPIAFVGKGITFDSGGLDIKPASGMRLMKKDMGGSAAVIGLAYWAARTGLKRSLDFYVALAENAVGGKSFRPSDIITARSGLKVEIHNTDAEGRLVLADALDVAVTAKEKPSRVVDVATLTGAIKVALGSQLAGLFSNDRKLAAALAEAGQKAGDPAWPMPLVQRYRASMNTTFADMVNAVDGYGGAITAALFLEKFVGNVPWAHWDVYAWRDAADGAWLESGGSGQPVLALAQWLSR